MNLFDELEIQKLDLKSGDLIVISISKFLPRNEISEILSQWKDVVGEDQLTVFIDGGLKIEQLTDEQLREIGLQRIDLDPFSEFDGLKGADDRDDDERRVGNQHSPNTLSE